MGTWRDWAEEHWASVATAVSICAALTLAAILALAFNVITTRFDGKARRTALPVSPANGARPLVAKTPTS
jgi:hypothetical protein